MQNKAKQITVAGVVAALYVVITLTPGISLVSYGPVQVRFAEILTVLPFVFPGAILGLFVGCLIANAWGAFMGMTTILDVVIGPLLTLLAAWLTFKLSKTKRPMLATIPPIIVNALGVPAYLFFAYGLPYWMFVLSVAIGQTIACYSLGYPLLVYTIKREKNFN